MAVTVKLPAVLRGDVDGQAALEVATTGTVGQVLEELALQWPRLGRRLRDERGQLRRFVNIYVDSEDCRGAGGLDAPVPDGAELLILPSVAGG